MNKSELAAKVADGTGLTRDAAAKAIDVMLDSITEALKAGEEIRLLGFGTFAVGESAARIGKNPRTGEPIEIAASKQPKFKAGKGLKDALNG